MTDRAVSGWGSWMGLVLQLVTLLHGYANPLKRLDTSEAVNLHKYLILLDSCWIHATRGRAARNRLVALRLARGPATQSVPQFGLVRRCCIAVVEIYPAKQSFVSAPARQS